MRAKRSRQIDSSLSALLFVLCALTLFLGTLTTYAVAAPGESESVSEAPVPVPAPVEVEAEAGTDLPHQYEGVGVTEHLGDKIPLDLSFKDENGRSIELSSLFREGRPVILTLVYYNCPMLCSLVLNGLVRGLRELDWDLGEDYQAVSVSISPTEGPELAQPKKENYLAQLGVDERSDGWRFLTGERPQIRALADAVGFGYRYDPRTGDFAHSAVIFVISPDGTISRYLHNINFEVKQLRLALTEAGEGKVGSFIDQLILRCFRYEPDAQRYSFYIWGAVRLGGILTIFFLGGFLLLLWRGERRAAASSAGPPLPLTDSTLNDSTQGSALDAESPTSSSRSDPS